MMDVPFGCPSIGTDLQGCPRAALWSPRLLTCLILTFPFPSVLPMLAKAWPCFPRHSELSGHSSEAYSTPTMMLLNDIHKRYIAFSLLHLPSLGRCQCLQHVLTVARPSNADKIFPIDLKPSLESLLNYFINETKNSKSDPRFPGNAWHPIWGSLNLLGKRKRPLEVMI